jgi:hypothetical protein
MKDLTIRKIKAMAQIAEALRKEKEGNPISF